MKRSIEPYDDYKELRENSLSDRWTDLRKKIFKDNEPEFDLDNKI